MFYIFFQFGSERFRNWKAQMTTDQFHLKALSKSVIVSFHHRNVPRHEGLAKLQKLWYHIFVERV